MAGFVGPSNFENSCFMDSVFVALFFPIYSNFFLQYLHPQTPVGKLTEWEEQAPKATKQWRDAFRYRIRKAVVQLHEPENREQWNLMQWRRLMPHCIYQPGNINFNANRPRSAVDFLRYLFHIIGVRDTLCSYQTSTTFIKKCPETEQGLNSEGLFLLWHSRFNEAVGYEKEDWQLLEDPDDREMLMSAPEGTTHIVNPWGDRQTISAVEHSSVFLCQLETEDSTVSITRPFEVNITYTPEDYDGDVYAQFEVSRFTNAPIVCIEVSRNLGPVKMDASVYFGDYEGGEWELDIMDTPYRLMAVVCHVGPPGGGHYVSFVRSNNNGGSPTWHYYDDIVGQSLVVEGHTMLEHPSNPQQHGELFIYALPEYTQGFT